MTPALAAAMIADTAREVRRVCDDLDASEHQALIRELKRIPSDADQGLAIVGLLRACLAAAHVAEYQDVLANAIEDVRCLADVTRAAESQSAREHKDHMRTSGRYRRAVDEGRD